jgi:site-specific DNA recombinase
MRYLIYARVSPRGSTWDKEETSIPDQVAQCRAYVEATDPGAVVDVVSDEFVHAWGKKRPGYNRILASLKDGSAVWDTLVVRHYDRLGRSLSDTLEIIKLLQAHGKGLISTTQRIDLSTPAGRAMLVILLVFAEWEREMLSERTKMRMVGIASQGMCCGPPPVGYVRRAKGDNALTVESRGAEKVRAAFEAYANGTKTTAQIAADLGMKDRKGVLYVLRNKIYIGLTSYDGKDYAGKHEPIIPPELFERVQKKIPSHPERHNPRPQAQRYPYILSGLIHCSCGASLTPASAWGRGHKRYNYYQCTNAECGRRLRAEEIEQQVLATISSLDLKDGAEVAGEARRLAQERGEMAAPELDRVTVALTAARQELERIKGLFLSGVVTQANAGIFNTELERVNREVQELTGRKDALKVRADPGLAVLFDPLEWARTLRTIGKALEVCHGQADQIREVIAAIVERIEAGDDKPVIHLRDGSPNNGNGNPAWTWAKHIRIEREGAVIVVKVAL